MHRRFCLASGKKSSSKSINIDEKEKYPSQERLSG